MTTTLYLTHRLKEVLTEGKWVTGTNYFKEISEVQWEDAIISIEGLNSIAKLTFHINYYLNGVNQVLKGGPLDIRDKYSFDMAPINNKQDWVNLLDTFKTNTNLFINLVEQLSDSQLQDGFFKKEYGNYMRNIDVMIEHCYYHLGQIVIIKKLISKKTNQQ